MDEGEVVATIVIVLVTLAIGFLASKSFYVVRNAEVRSARAGGLR